MSKVYYKKNRLNKRRSVRLFGLGLAVIGIFNLLYFFFPFLSWHLYFAPVFASQKVISPLPKSQTGGLETLGSLFATGVQSAAGVDYTNAANWFPEFQGVKSAAPVSHYTISIPKLTIQNALVSTIDNNLSQNMVNYAGTAVPPEKGNAVVFGHSTLPQLYDPKNYKTILAHAYKLKVGDTLLVHHGSATYSYRIFKITITEPADTSVLAQDFDDSYLTIITCTPPGTIWKRLVIKSRLEKI